MHRYSAQAVKRMVPQTYIDSPALTFEFDAVLDHVVNHPQTTNPALYALTVKPSLPLRPEPRDP